MRGLTLQAFRYFTENIGAVLTPEQINKHMGNGDYASRHVAVLRNKFGLNITSLQQGHKVIGYRLDSKPKLPTEVRNAVNGVKPKRGRPRLTAKIEPAANQVVVPVSVIAAPTGRGKRKNFILSPNHGINPNAFLVMPSALAH